MPAQKTGLTYDNFRFPSGPLYGQCSDEECLRYAEVGVFLSESVQSLPRTEDNDKGLYPVPQQRTDKHVISGPESGGIPNPGPESRFNMNYPTLWGQSTCR